MTALTLTCDRCGRRNRWMLRYPETGHLACGRCAGSADAHEHEFPDCSDRWHDGYDHDAAMVRAVEERDTNSAAPAAETNGEHHGR